MKKCLWIFVFFSLLLGISEFAQAQTEAERIARVKMAVEIVVRQTLESQFRANGGFDFWNPNSGYYHGSPGREGIRNVSIDLESTTRSSLDPVALGVSPEELSEVLKAVKNRLYEQMRSYVNFWNWSYRDRADKAMEDYLTHAVEATRAEVNRRQAEAAVNSQVLQWQFVAQILDNKLSMKIAMIVADVIKETLRPRARVASSCKALFG